MLSLGLPVDPEGLPTLRSMLISMFSPLKPVFVTGCVAWTQGMFVGSSVSGVFPAPAMCGAQGPSPLPWLWETPFPSRIDPAEPHLGFSHFPKGQAGCSRRVWSLGVNTDPWIVSVQQLQLIPVAWERQGDQEQPLDTPAGSWCPRQEEKGAGTGWVGITSCCSWGSGLPGLGLPSHHIFFPEVFYGS